MRRSLQEYVELVVFGLIALLVGTGLLWVVGWVLALGGIVLKSLAGLLWMLLRFIVPVAIAGGLVYFLVKAIQGRQGKERAAEARVDTGSAATTPPVDPSYTPPASSSVAAGAPVANESPVDVPAATGGVTNGNIALDGDVDDVAGDVVADPVTTEAGDKAADDQLEDDQLADELEDELAADLADDPEDDLADDDRDRA